MAAAVGRPLTRFLRAHEQHAVLAVAAVGVAVFCVLPLGVLLVQLAMSPHDATAAWSAPAALDPRGPVGRALPGRHRRGAGVRCAPRRADRAHRCRRPALRRSIARPARIPAAFSSGPRLVPCLRAAGGARLGRHIARALQRGRGHSRSGPGVRPRRDFPRGPGLERRRPEPRGGGPAGGKPSSGRRGHPPASRDAGDRALGHRGVRARVLGTGSADVPARRGIPFGGLRPARRCRLCPGRGLRPRSCPSLRSRWRSWRSNGASWAAGRLPCSDCALQGEMS